MFLEKGGSMSAGENKSNKLGWVALILGLICVAASLLFSQRSQTSLSTPLMASGVVVVIIGVALLLFGRTKL